MRTALITGAAGQDGGYLAEELLADGYEVHGTVRHAQEASVESHPWLGDVHLHILDVCDAGAVDALMREVRPDEVFNLAAVSSVGLSWENPVLTADVNAMAVARLLQAALDYQEASGRPVSFVQASSAEIFGDAATVPQDETTEIRPTNPYGAAKAFAHQMVGVYRTKGLHASACVLYNHESPRRPEVFVTRKITAAAAKIAAGKQEALMLGTLAVRRDWGWAPDYAHAMALTARHLEPTDFVVATGVHHSIEDFVAVAFERVGLDWRAHVTTDPQFVRPADNAMQVGHAAKARNLMGWTTTRDFRQLVETMVDADVQKLRS